MKTFCLSKAPKFPPQMKSYVLLFLVSPCPDNGFYLFMADASYHTVCQSDTFPSTRVLCIAIANRW